MEELKSLGFWAGLLSMIAFVPYWYSIFSSDGDTRPQRASWFIWIFADVMVLQTSIATGSTENIPLLWAYVIGTIITFFLSLIKGKGGTHWFDFVCIGATALSFVLWKYTGDAFTALIINIFVFLVGGALTLIKVVGEPYSENLPAYILWISGSILSLSAIILASQLELKFLIQPIAGLITQIIIIFVMIRGRYTKQKV